MLRSCSGDVDIILAREPDQDQGPAHAQTAAPVERRRRRRLPTIERPKSAPIYNGLVDFRSVTLAVDMVKFGLLKCHVTKKHSKAED